MRSWTFKDGPKKGETVIMLRAYTELEYPDGCYVWDEKKEDYIWYPGRKIERDAKPN